MRRMQTWGDGDWMDANEPEAWARALQLPRATVRRFYDRFGDIPVMDVGSAGWDGWSDVRSSGSRVQAVESVAAHIDSCRETITAESVERAAGARARKAAKRIEHQVAITHQSCPSPTPVEHVAVVEETAPAAAPAWDVKVQ